MTTWWERLDREREAKGWSGRQLAKEAGIEYAVVNKYLNGKIAQPRGNAMQKLANAINRPLLWLRDGTEEQRDSATPSTARVSLGAIIGKVEAGTFREVDPFDQSERATMEIPVDPRFPHARQLIFEVSGDSMNNLKPRPILEGDRIVGIAYEDVEGQMVLRDGMVVVVERTRDDGQYREWSVKELVLLKDRTEFHPRSTNPRHKPIVVDRDLFADDGTKVNILALVRRIINELPYDY
jgi:transcriptional regulator with XRE-family HTH domain